MIKRVIADTGSASAADLQAISQKSCSVLEELGPDDIHCHQKNAMHVTRFEGAKVRRPPSFRHALRAVTGQGSRPFAADVEELSLILPGGCFAQDGLPMEKLCLVLEGRLALLGKLDRHMEEHELGACDSCRFAPGEKRQVTAPTARCCWSA